MSNLSAFPYIAERSEGTPGLWNYPLSIISANIAALDSGLTSSSPSGNTFSILTNIETSGGAHFQFLSVGSTPPSYVTTAAITVEVNSAYSDYMYFIDSSAQKSSYVIGSRAGGTGDGLNIWDASGATMIVSFSKQSTRFYGPVVGQTFDSGGEVFNVKVYGAIGNDVADDGPAIQSAINVAADGGTIFFPSGTYRLNSRITVTKRLVLLGLPNDGVKLNCNVGSGQTAITWQPSSLLVRVGQGMRDISLIGQGINDGQTLLALIRAAGFVAHQVTFGGDEVDGVSKAICVRSDSWNQLYSHCFFGSCSVVYENTGAANSGEQNTFFHTTFAGGPNSAKNAIRLEDNAADVHFFMCAFDSSQVSMSQGRIDFLGCHWEDPNSGLTNTPFMHINGGRITVVGGNLLSGSTTTSLIAVGGNADLWMYGVYGQSNGTNNNHALVSVFSSGANVFVDHNTVQQTFQLASVFTGISSRATQNLFLGSGRTSQLSGPLHLGTDTTAERFSCSTMSLVDASGGVAIAFPNSAALRTGHPGTGNVYWDVGRFNIRLGDATAAGPISCSTLSLVDPSGGVGMLFPGGSAIRTGINSGTNQLVYLDVGQLRIRDGDGGETAGWLSTHSGSATTPALNYYSETSLGLYRSGASTIAFSYGTIDLTGSGAITSIASLKIKAGANNSCGTAVLGSNGSVNVANTYVKTGDLIFLTDQTAGGTLGDLELGGIRNSSGFTIQSTSLTDTSTVGWLIIRPG